MKRFISVLIGLIITYVCLLIGVNFLWFFRYHDWKTMVASMDLAAFNPKGDLSLYFEDTVNKQFFIIMVMLIAFVWIGILLNKLAKHNERNKHTLTGYERKSYSKLLSTRRRKRGTLLVQYDANGQITRNTIEALFENILEPVTKLQNKIAYEYNWSPNKWWNTRQNYKKLDADGNYRKVSHCGGIPVISRKRFFIAGKYNYVRYLTGNVHAAFIGMTGKGKSQSLVLPMLNSMIDAGENIVLNDPKSELLNYTREKLEREGYNVIVLNFHDPKAGDGWNPLDYPYKTWKKELKKSGKNKNEYRQVNMSRATEMILDIARTIAFEEDAKEPTWWQGAASMIAGASHLLFEEGYDEYINFKSVKMLYSIGDDNADGSKTILAKYLEKFREVDDKSVMEMDVYLSSKSVTKASYMSTFNSKLKLLTATDDIIEMTSHSTFDLEQVFREKTAIFLLTQDEKATYYPLVTMFFKQLYEAGIKVTKEKPEGKLPIPMNWLIDEFAVLPEIIDIENIYAAARSRGLRMYTFFQSISQLYDKYEKHTSDTILDNNTHIVYLGSGNDETIEWFSDRAGVELYYDKWKKEYRERPVISTDRLKKMHRGRMLFTSVEWNPYIAKLPEFKRYTFASEMKQGSKYVEKGAVYYFDIKKEYSKRIRDEASRVEHNNEPVPEFDWDKTMVSEMD